MPGPLRSPELARKAKERLPHIAVLFTSGYTDNAIVHGGRLDEGIELLSKPYTREALARKVRYVLGNRQSAQPAPSPPPPTASAETVATASLTSPLRILLVEDEPLILMSTTDMLETLGHMVFEATSAEEALSVLEQEDVDVLMTDHGLPGMSGADLAVACRRRQPELAIVFSSGMIGIPQIDGHQLISDAVLLGKPYEQAGLATALAQFRRK